MYLSSTLPFRPQDDDSAEVIFLGPCRSNKECSGDRDTCVDTHCLKGCRTDRDCDAEAKEECGEDDYCVVPCKKNSECTRDAKCDKDLSICRKPSMEKLNYQEGFVYLSDWFAFQGLLPAPRRLTASRMRFARACSASRGGVEVSFSS